jgi:hypothetical protein
MCYCLKLRRATPAGVALGVTDWKVVESGVLLPKNGSFASLPDWIASHVRAFSYFGGAARQTISDNLKAGVPRLKLFLPGPGV